MRRSRPDDHELRRFMRFLHDPHALRKNALARVLVDPADERRFAETLHELVRSVLPPGSRAATIVERCDIEGVPHKVVAADLGLSLRHFYRERRRAREALREALVMQPAAAVANERADAVRDAIEMQHAAIDFGHAETVVRAASALLDAGVPGDMRTAVRVLRARAAGENGDRAQAHDELSHCERDAEPDSRDAGECLHARAALADADGERGTATTLSRRAVELTALGPASSDRDRRVHARMLAFYANQLQGDHDPHGAIAAFESARDVLRGCGAEPLAQQTRILIDLAVTRYAIAPMIDRGVAEALHALRTATWHGLVAERDWAEVVLALGPFANPSAGGIRALRLPVTLDHGFAGQWLARMRMLVSRIETARGDAEAALRSVREARRHIPPHHHLHANADLREAEALLALGEAAVALPLASGAIERISTGASSHYSGAAHLCAAEALARLGRRRSAREHCEAGVATLRRGAFVRDLARGLRLAANLTGDERYAREERSLLAG